MRPNLIFGSFLCLWIFIVSILENGDCHLSRDTNGHSKDVILRDSLDSFYRMVWAQRRAKLSESDQASRSRRGNSLQDEKSKTTAANKKEASTGVTRRFRPTFADRFIPVPKRAWRPSRTHPWRPNFKPNFKPRTSPVPA